MSKITRENKKDRGKIGPAKPAGKRTTGALTNARPNDLPNGGTD